MTNNGEIKIEKGVPIVGSRGGQYDVVHYPWAAMEISDSFMIAMNGADKRTVEKKQSSLSRAGYLFVKKHQPSSRFVTRQVDGGVRVWRVA